jgi:tryptophan synthase alpha chain
MNEGSPVEAVLQKRKAAGEGALIGYLPVGYPNLAESIEAACAMADGGVDVIELGLPYSDPVMDGPVIQAATVEALENGFTLKDGLAALKQITSRVSTPVLVMTYWNPVMQYGVDAFARDLKNAGGAGMITPDLIPDEGQEWIDVAKKHDLDHVFLAAPSSSDTRLAQAVDSSRGFVYAVSTMGVTGARNDVDSAARELVARLRTADCSYTCVGLGISQPEHVQEVLEYADGAIVGSAFVRALADGGVSAVRSLAQQLSDASHSASRTTT